MSLGVAADIACDLWLKEEEEMAKLSMAERKKLPKSDFAVPSKAPGPGSYPMPDKKHEVAAKGLAGMHHASSKVKGKINAKGKAKFGKDKGARKRY